ncbi:DUF3570 domain-containing protein [Pontibacter indicus]|uniref:DUF3570 domain-containing protein n=1 Tax=Pontibacter indicus TaxID=1317125 RepID=A0A1R3WIE4_9BACT|nr:DUF3570 domain-containing protein [Pontibacter indicus]SIT77695.1 Protein of unknown function [Pontibacter indicus]
MQLRYIGLLVACTMATSAFAQTTSTTAPARRVRRLEPAEVNILGSYYSQDGTHSPVTGGIGTEQLTDVTPTVIVNVPLDTVTNLNISFGMDFYSSASTDNIDYNVSSASSSDMRTHLNIGLSRRNYLSRSTRSLFVGGSTEYDYQSVSVGAGWAQESRDGNRELSLMGMIYYDTWTLIYPEELRNGKSLVSTNKRQSYNLSATLSQVINQKMQASLSADIVYQSGLLSTPFHRVYFQEQAQAQVEQLPDQRLKYPIGLRVNYYVNDFVTSRFFYRFYSDNWGITANTIELETPIKFGPFFSFYPFYRFHTQTAASYFAPYKAHSLSQEFYTSDYDLSGFTSHKAGLGLRYSPLSGIGKFGLPFGKNKTSLKGIELRGANYWRSDGLKAFIISTDLNFTLPSRK